MTHRMLMSCALVALLVSGVVSSAAQVDERVSANELKLAVVPMTKDELGGTKDKRGLLAGWMAALKAKAEAISKLQIAAETAKDGGTAALEQVEALKLERTEVLARCEIVAKALEAKGGDVAAERKYMTAVNTTGLETGGMSAYWVVVKTWFTSSEGGLQWLKNIAAFLAILFVFKLLSAILGNVVHKALGKFGKDTSALLKNFITNCVRKVVFFIGLIVALSMIGVDITPFLAAIGAAGFIIGFALQGTLSNFASGVMILLYRPYDIGNFVNVSGQAGKVEAMTLVSTTILTPDNQRVIVPNSSIWGDVITNVTGSETRRVDMMFGIGYDDDIERAKSVLEELVTKHELVLDDPAPVVQLHELADSSVNFVVRPWSKTGDYWAVYWDLTRAVKDRFDKEGISIPYPQQDVHMHEVKPATA